jgi:hypothetical protein
MQEAVIAAGFLVVAAIVGSLLKPNADQLRPLFPEASSAGDGHDHHHDSHH